VTVYVYALVDPVTHSVRYVGRSRKLIARYSAHMSYWAGNKAKTKWIKSLRRAGMRPALLVLERCKYSTVAEAERKWIEHHRSSGMLFNDTTDRTALTHPFNYRGRNRAT